jgi:hypothetical protein
MSSADFTLNGASAPPELAVAGGATVTLALVSITGVRTIVWSIVGNDSHTRVNPTITPAGSPLGATATFTMPAGTGQGYRVQCQVNGGVDDEGTYQPQLTKTAIVGVINAAGFVPFCSGETTERNATYGYTEQLNLLANAGGTSGLADHSVTTAKIQQFAANTLVGNPTGALADVQAVTLGSGLAFVAGALTLAAAGIALSALATIADQRILGNVSGGTASPIALTATQVNTFLPTFVASGASHAKGLVPDPGVTGGSTKFLREDATWAVPSGSFTGPATPADDNKLAYANAGAIGWRAGVTTPIANGLAFLAELTGANLRVEHNTNVLTGKDSGAVGYQTLIRWGVTANNELALGGGGSANEAASILFQTRPTTGSFTTKIGTSAVATITAAGATHTSLASTGTVAPAFTVTDAAHTALTASTERVGVTFDLSQTKQWATGALTTQRTLRVLAPTLAFVGASTITTAATVAISAAPIAGTNATITQGLALWIEAGGIGYGSSAALSGLNRIAQNATYLVGRSSTSTDINLARWGVTATDALVLGDDGAASVGVYATTSFNLRLGAAAEWDFTAAQLDCHSNNIVNLLALNGTRVATGTLGTTLADANETLSVAGGSVYEQITALTANRSKGLAITGSPKDKQVISIRRYTADAFTLQINDEVGGALFIFPAGLKGIADFQYSTATSKFVLAGYMPLS